MFYVVNVLRIDVLKLINFVGWTSPNDEENGDANHLYWAKEGAGLLAAPLLSTSLNPSLISSTSLWRFDFLDDNSYDSYLFPCLLVVGHGISYLLYLYLYPLVYSYMDWLKCYALV